MDKAKEIFAKVLVWWNKFTSKQKTAIIAGAAGAVLLLVIVISLITKEQFVLLKECETTSSASEIIEVLEGAGIEYKTSDDALIVYADSSKISEARLAIGSAGIMPDAYSIDNVTSGGFSTTEADKQKKYIVYLEEKIAQDLRAYEAVKDASVRLYIPEEDGTLISMESESSAAVQLELNGTFNSDNASAMAQYVSFAIGNETTANIIITDTSGNLLFSGEEDYSTMGIASNMLQLREQAQAMVAVDVKKVLIGTNQFGNIEVVSRLDIDYSSYEETVHRYYAEDDRVEGMIVEQQLSESEGSNGSGGVPGTDSNDEDTYVWQSGSESESSESSSYTTYAPNEMITNILTNPGVINYSNSSVAITMLSYNQITEEEAKDQGYLDGITWEEYKIANSEDVKLEVDEDLYAIVSTATGIDADRIAIIAYKVNTFVDKEGFSLDWSIAVSIGLLILILALLVFVVLHSMKKQNIEEEKALSVEKLLQSTSDTVVEEIDLEAKSETRKLIEKFVDENPEAAANLLRNWLNEDWG